MISTYIYGSPHGFNFFEGIASWNDYFKSFYISTRRGKRLMVNRKEDGTTIYSYLCYGLMEKEGRPNAFFGISIVLDDYKFTPDLKILFEWFDYLFDKLFSRGNLFFINEGGILQYRIDKFSDVSVEVDWLKSNLPNIFTKSSDIQLLTYDNSFSKQNLGKVICCNIDTPNLKIIDNLKRFHWIAISPNFAPEQEIEEINISDLESKLNEYNQEILTIAVNPSAETLPLLTSIEADCSDIISTLRNYEQSASDVSERKNINDVAGKYIKLRNNISALIDKITQGLSKPQNIKNTHSTERKRRCVSCNRFLSNEYFLDPDSEVCIDCQKREKAQSRICKKCHSKKPLSNFTKIADVCDDCARQSIHSRLGQIKPAYITIFILLAIVTISIFLVSKSCSNTTTPAEGQTLDASNIDKAAFDEAHFQDLLNSGKYSEAIEYLDSLDQKENHIQDVRNAVNNKIMNILETSNKSEILEQCLTFTTSNMGVITELGLDATKIKEFAQNYQRLCEIATQSEISKDTRNEANRLIEMLPEDLRKAWTERINNIPDKAESAQPTALEAETSKEISVKITNTNKEGTEISSKTIKISKETTLQFKTGTFVTIQCPDGVRLTKGSGSPVKNGMKVELQSVDIIFVIGNKIKLTIKPQKNGFTHVN